MSAAPASSWPESQEAFWSWQAWAACRGADTTLFYSPEGERGARKARRERAAKAICAGCPVVEVCAAYAVAGREPYGTWGGLTESERVAMWPRLDPSQAVADYRRALATFEPSPRLDGPAPHAARAKANGPPYDADREALVSGSTTSDARRSWMSASR
jgi:WhiB family redox-sensing transcriptional regulator